MLDKGELIYDGGYFRIYDDGFNWWRINEVEEVYRPVMGYHDRDMKFFEKPLWYSIYYFEDDSYGSEVVHLYRGHSPTKTKLYKELKRKLHSREIYSIGHTTLWDYSVYLEEKKKVLRSKLKLFVE